MIENWLSTIGCKKTYSVVTNKYLLYKQFRFGDVVLEEHAFGMFLFEIVKDDGLEWGYVDDLSKIPQVVVEWLKCS